MNPDSETLLAIIQSVAPRIQQITEADARIERGPGWWSRKEIIGHLIDSATNNHRRFVTANFQDGLVFEGYGQEEWVAIQDYQNDDWQGLIDFWVDCNRRIARLIGQIPDAVKLKQHNIHCLHKMAWASVPENEPSTLDYLIKDYIGHLEHHVRQVLPDYEPVMIGNY